MTKRGDLTFYSLLLFCLRGVTSLRDVRLIVEPPVVIRGGTAALTCYRDMQGTPLYSVKWYRGNHEFYRYTPNELPNTRVFGLPGIYVDAPLPGPTWTEIFDANVTNIVCPQIIPPIFEAILATKLMIEDCLLANIYTPDTKEVNLPVLVTIHGGSYQNGWGDFASPKAMVEQGNFIAVTVNYRLGIHGFLCLGTEDIPGNAGLKDLLAALRWVKNNIASFGGNPDDITLSGYSAGAGAAELFMLSETTRGLFNKVVPESGSGIAVWNIQRNPTKLAKEFARTYLKFESDNIEALDNIYKTKSLNELLVGDFRSEKDSTTGFVPCIERETGSENVEIFLKDDPIDIMKKGKYTQMPMLYGFTDMEGLFRISMFEQWKDEMNENFSDFLPADLSFKSNEEREQVGKTVKKFYFNDEAVSNKTRLSYVKFFGDILFAYPALQSLKLHVKAGNNAIYLYEYSYVNDILQSLNPYNIRGAGHTAQSSALTDNGVLTGLSDEYKNMVALMRKLWINFYKTGRPLAEPTSEFPQGWPAASANGSPYMNLDNPSTLKGVLLEKRMKFWEKIYKKHYQKPLPPRLF